MKNILGRLREYLSIRRNWKKVVYFAVLICGFTYLFWGVPLPTKLSSSDIPVSTKLLDRNGKLIYEIYTDKRRTPIELSEIPDYIKKGTIAIEDKKFYKHGGFDITGLIRGLSRAITRGHAQGGSTITQQLVKNALLTPERTIIRKIREFILTVVVEGIYTKDQILEMYLNQIPYGSTAYGIESASELYFGKEAKNLSLAEAALLIGLPASPSKYSPFGSHPELAVERQKLVLESMVEEKYISEEEMNKALAEKLNFAKITPPKAPHFALWVKEQLAEKYGEKVVEQGGLRVTTTLDLELQEIAQQSVATEVGKLKKQNVGNGAAIVTRPATGEILAMVGSKDYFSEDEDGKVNVVLSQRQPGSSIKPLNYALAVKDERITAATTFSDAPTCFSVVGQELYCPQNYDGTYHGLVQARFALGNSYNIPAVKVLSLNGVEGFVEFARNMGLSTLTDPKNYGLSLTLGGGEVRPIDMAEAYGVFANQGIKQPLIAITKVTDWKGNTLEETKITDKELSGERILDPGVTFLISHILLDNNARSLAFGEVSQLNVKGHPEVSVKTGTTNDRRDNWTIGYTQHAVVTVWVGNNDNKPMSGAVSGVSGASPIWNKVMKATLDFAENGKYNKEDDGHAWPMQPANVIGGNICATTGLKPLGSEGSYSCPTRFEYFLEGTVPTITDGERQDIQIYNDTQQMALGDFDPSQVSTQNRPIYKDPVGAIYCMDCPISSASATIRYPLK